VKIIRTHEMNPEQLTEFEKDCVYNGLDCCVTRDCLDAMLPQLDPTTLATYTLSRALQGPTLEMRCRGVLVDQVRKSEVIDEYFESMDRLEAQLEKIVLDGVGLPTFNWRSTRDLQRLFYDELGIPPIRRSGRPTVDRAARERLEVYPIAQQLIKHINALTELGDKISVLKTAIDPDGRIRTSYNIAGTSTGRFSSSFSEFGTGGNLQNVEESLRSIFIADPGYKFAKCDAKSGESYCVGAIEWNLFGDGKYLDAIESGDIHTAVARFTWPNLPWTGDRKLDREIADQKFYRHLTRRDMCKKLGHGSSYGGKPQTLADQSRVPIDLVTDFQRKFFATFPAHQQWQAWVDDTLRRKGHLVSLMGRRRWFFGRRNDPKTLREAIAYDPQSSLRDIVSTALLKIWRAGYVIIAMDDHDALTFMYPEKDEDKIIPMLKRDLIVPVPLAGGRTLRIPYDCEVGWNKGKYHPEKNPNGLKEYTGHDDRRREAAVGILDRIICRPNRKSA
jgi:DNA polymerase I-like protein with 3'-5' exonuclease and polymerase domains